MAISKVDRNSKIMQEDFGTVCLITDSSADKYLRDYRKKMQYSAPEDSNSRWCGGKNGFDLFVERLNE